MTSTQMNEFEVVLSSDELGNDSYIKRKLVDVKIKVLREIAQAADIDFNQKVAELCPEAKDFPELLEIYGITLPIKSDSKNVLKLKKNKKKHLSKTKTSQPAPEPQLKPEDESDVAPEPKPEDESDVAPEPKPEDESDVAPKPEPKPKQKKKKVLKRKSNKSKEDS